MSMTPDEFWNILHNVPAQHPIFYRLYYKDDGSPVAYTMEDLPGKYIDIDRETYVRSPTNVKVVDGKIIETVPAQIIYKLRPGSKGTPCSEQDVCIIVKPAQPHQRWGKHTHEYS